MIRHYKAWLILTRALQSYALATYFKRITFATGIDKQKCICHSIEACASTDLVVLQQESTSQCAHVATFKLHSCISLIDIIFALGMRPLKMQTQTCASNFRPYPNHSAKRSLSCWDPHFSARCMLRHLGYSSIHAV